MKKLSLIFTGAFALVSGAFAAPPTHIASLPVTIDQPGNYILDPSAAAQPVNNYAIFITASNVDLELSGQQIDCNAGSYGIVVGNNANHVSISNGTVNELVQ